MVTFTPNSNPFKTTPFNVAGKENDPKKRFKEEYEAAKKLISLDENKGAPKGTVPIGDGWYATPDTPADPQDCDRYPNSPWCKTPGVPDFKKPFSIDITPKLHRCGFDLEITGTAAYVPMPTNKIAYRYEGECRNEPEKPKAPDLGQGEKRYNKPKGIPTDAIVYAFVGSKFQGASFTQQPGDRYGNPSISTDSYEEEFLWNSYICPGNKAIYYIAGAPYNSPVSGKGTARLTGTSTETYLGNTQTDPYNQTRDIVGEYDIYDHYGVYHRCDVAADGRIVRYRYSDGTTRYNMPEPYPPIIGQIEVVGSGALESGAGIWFGRWGLIDKYLDSIPAPQSYSDVSPSGQFISSSTGSLEVTVNFVVYQDCKPYNPYETNPPPDNDEDCNCMTCCNQPKDISEGLLKAILAEIKKLSEGFPFNATIYDEDETKQEAQSKTLQIRNLSTGLRTVIDRNEKLGKIIGIDALPLEVPKSITSPIDQNIIGATWDWLTGNDKEVIHNLFEYHVWFLNQFSAVLGNWQLEIKVEDTDILKEGKQGIPTGDGENKSKIVLPDMATSFKEMMMLQIQQYKSLGLAVDILLKNLTETAATHQTAGRIIAQIDEVVEFLDYPTDDSHIEVPVQITVPGKDVSQQDQNDLGKYLKPSTTKVRYDKWTKEQSLSDLLTHLATLIGSRGGASQ